jgi:hypothetical protein
MSKYLKIYSTTQSWENARVRDIRTESRQDLGHSLSVNKIDDIKDVVAISHVWGKEQKHAIENIKGVDHKVMISSHEKIRHIISAALKRGYCNLWMDNICIDQDDTAQKSVEIKKMTRIYRDSMATIIVLDSTKEELLKRLHNKTQVMMNRSNIIDELPTIGGDINYIMEDAWFDRLWTMQESTLAKKLYILPADGDKLYDITSWKNNNSFWEHQKLIPDHPDLMREINKNIEKIPLSPAGQRFISENPQLVEKWRRRNEESIANWDRIPNVTRINNFANRWLCKAETTYIDALIATKDKKYVLYPDRVYGMLGMVKDTSMVPKYKDIILDDICLMMFEDSVNNLRQMDLLHVDGFRINDEGCNMIPDWSSITVPNAAIGRIVHDGRCSYRSRFGLEVQGARVYSANIVIRLDKKYTDDLECVQRLNLVEDKLIRGIMYQNALLDYHDNYTYLPKANNAALIRNIWLALLSSPRKMSLDQALKLIQIKNRCARGNKTEDDCLIRACRECLKKLMEAERGAIIEIKNGTVSYLSVIKTDLIKESEDLIAIDYSGKFVKQSADRMHTLDREDRLPLIIAHPMSGGKRAKFVGTTIQNTQIRKVGDDGGDITII